MCKWLSRQPPQLSLGPLLPNAPNGHMFIFAVFIIVIDFDLPFSFDNLFWSSTGREMAANRATVADRRWRTLRHASCPRPRQFVLRMQMFARSGCCIVWPSGHHFGRIQSFGGQIHGQLFLLRQLETMCSA